MAKLSSLIRADKEFSSYIDSLFDALRKDSSYPISINGLSGGATYAFVAESAREYLDKWEKPMLILVPTEDEAIRVSAYLSAAEIPTLVYKHRKFIFNSIGASHDTERERLSVLFAVASGEPTVIVTTPAAAISRTMPMEYLLSKSIRISIGMTIPPTELCDRLVGMGYAFSDAVEGKGQFSYRGGIVDFYPGDFESPVRVEFFGDEVDRMVSFDPITQRSSDACSEVLLLPATEVVLDSEAKSRVSALIGDLMKKCPPEARPRYETELSMLEGGIIADFKDKYIGAIYEKFDNLLTFFTARGRFSAFVLGTAACRECAQEEASSYADITAALTYKKEAPHFARYSYSASEYNDFLEKLCVCTHVNSFSGGLGNTALHGIFGFRCRRTVSYGQNLGMLKEDLLHFKRDLYRTVILTETRAGLESLRSTLSDEGIDAIPIPEERDFDIRKYPGGVVFLAVGDLEGYDLMMPRVALLSMAVDEGRRVMANKRRQRILKKAGGATARLMSHADLSVGDYVVHANYGIGLFEGIETVTTMGVTRDYITIRYAGTDKLFVPCDRLEVIGKYIGARDSDGKVKLSKMGGGDFARAKARAKSAAKDIAKDLIKLYAERQRLEGFAHCADSDLELQFADSFEYEETESQLQAIEEIKKDMMRPVPMNRLLCGDVGYGKTEVALRAAFKAIMSNKQVAILVPTTILALQHYQTALSRMREYPVKVEMLSGLKTPREEERILRAVARGEVDILIGTHKLLSDKMKFRDLGLLIIDEEQRFGVGQKEKLKEMARCVDTLTLSATPIPRTLNMAMNGICDMSILDEAPGVRMPVQTYVLEHDEVVICDAIRRELQRGGQVLYLYNKVEDITFVADRIGSSFKEARIAVGHGQMARDELEEIWQALVNHEVDILVCTTIIETGVDLPNANTLIIENADRFGLSQLHQIRGRVGRSERQAYAYFTYRRGKALTEIADRRLRAIREFTEFGAGFKVALRDLEIRGAGNLLGAEQHGYIESVGYDLYVKLLSEAVLEERGIKEPERVNCVVDIKVSANIPEGYIKTSAGRMEMYKKISAIRTPEDLYDVQDELMDRYGSIPRATDKLLDIALIKALAEEADITKVEIKQGCLVFSTASPNAEIWASVMSGVKGLMFRASPPSVIRRIGQDEPISLARGILEEYHKEKKKEEG